MAKQNAGMGGGWGAAVMNILFIVFSISVVFGVFLIAVVQVGNTLQGTTGSQTDIGNSSQSAYQTYENLVSYLVTLAQFVGIIILLAIVGVLIYVLGSGVFGFLTGGGR